jgi:DNA-binding GntR family transcriptional regulator
MVSAQHYKEMKGRPSVAKDTRSKKVIAYEAIKHRILSNEYTPGMPIIEPELGLELQVSKTPIREALQELERDGLIETIPGRGSFVSHITVEDIRQIFDSREIIECGVVRRVALIGDKEIIQLKKKELESFHSGAEASLLDSPERDDVHLTIFKLLGNHKLFAVYSQLLDHIIRLRNYFNVKLDGDRAQVYNQEHLRILDALLEGSPDKAEQATMTHLRNAAKYLTTLTTL